MIEWSANAITAIDVFRCGSLWWHTSVGQWRPEMTKQMAVSAMDHMAKKDSVWRHMTLAWLARLSVHYVALSGASFDPQTKGPLFGLVRVTNAICMFTVAINRAGNKAILSWLMSHVSHRGAHYEVPLLRSPFYIRPARATHQNDLWLMMSCTIPIGFNAMLPF